jgi:hypothetical protein
MDVQIAGQVGEEDEGVEPLSDPYRIEGVFYRRGSRSGSSYPLYGGALAGRRLRQHSGRRNATLSIEIFAIALSNKKAS